MFEITVSSAKTKNRDIPFIIDKLRPKIKAIKAIMVCEEFDGRVNLAVATQEKNKDELLSHVFDVVSEAIVRNYKYSMLLNCLKNKINDEIMLFTFTKALTVFDKTSDKDFIKAKLKPTSVINIDSFYYFKLWELEKRWNNLASLLCENNEYIMSKENINELMRFLLNTNEAEYGEIFLHLKENKVLAKSTGGAEIFSFEYNNDNNSIIKIISELIGLSPQKIVLSKEVAGLEIASYLTNLYDGKVSILK